MAEISTVLLIDDKENIRTVMSELLRSEGWKVLSATDGKEGLAAAIRHEPDVIVSDIRMDGIDGIELFHLLRSRGYAIPFIFVTAYGTVEEAVSMLQEGAVHYLTKPVNISELKLTIHSILRSKNSEGTTASRRLVGSSTRMESVYGRIASLARSNSTVLISGESGTGKELIARAIHEQSSRRHNHFVPVNCSTFSDTLLGSELFGYEKGAFTGADCQKIGYFEFAHGGTLFLDEVSELSPGTQVALLRVLQERVIHRVGSTEAVAVDIRLIAATNRNLQDLMASGSFRQDLYYRLNVVPLDVPALRDRTDDLQPLARYFIERVCDREGLGKVRIHPLFYEPLKSYSWPGNVRELENFIERLLVIHRPVELTADLVRDELPSGFSDKGFALSSAGEEKEHIINAIIASGGNKTNAAKMLNMPRRTLYNKLRQLKISDDELKS